MFLLSFVQGITEFLPVSSSAHLILFQNMLQNDFGLFFDISLHFGSILAVFMFYRSEFIKLIKSLFVYDKSLNNERHLILKLIVGTLPIIIAGFFLYGVVADDARNIALIAINCILFGVVLYIADRFFSQKKGVNEISYKNAFIIGLFQVLALLPGVSRSGITITGARFLNVKRIDAIQFSVFLSLPVIVGAMVYAVYKNVGKFVFDWELLLGIFFSFIISYVALWLFVKIAKKFSFTFFAVYRILLGLFLLYLIAY
ncbi:MAG: undecaprenyl-diphosphate phosphatase [Rickettsiales bacterium]|jgi:undecaprenyl-diphosphatase|nr:undecaprenyl-diphosphate phosphatase [Rickettsiales bacterium]